MSIIHLRRGIRRLAEWVNREGREWHEIGTVRGRKEVDSVTRVQFQPSVPDQLGTLPREPHTIATQLAGEALLVLLFRSFMVPKQSPEQISWGTHDPPSRSRAGIEIGGWLRITLRGDSGLRRRRGGGWAAAVPIICAGAAPFNGGK
jgi:hypothetical protein